MWGNNWAWATGRLALTWPADTDASPQEVGHCRSRSGQVYIHHRSWSKRTRRISHQILPDLHRLQARYVVVLWFWRVKETRRTWRSNPATCHRLHEDSGSQWLIFNDNKTMKSLIFGEDSAGAFRFRTAQRAYQDKSDLSYYKAAVFSLIISRRIYN